MISEEAILYYADHPVEFVEDIIGATPDPEQAEILRSVAKNPMTTVRSGHGVGKSTVEAWVVIWFITTRPFPKIHAQHRRSTSYLIFCGRRSASG